MVVFDDGVCDGGGRRDVLIKASGGVGDDGGDVLGGVSDCVDGNGVGNVGDCVFRGGCVDESSASAGGFGAADSCS